MAISCGHCGGQHESPAEVRTCWASGSESESVATAAPVVGSSVAPPATAPPRRGGFDLGVGSLRPPTALGRTVVVGSGARPPDAWHDAEVVRIGIGLDGGRRDDVIARLRSARQDLRPVVIELDQLADGLSDPDRPPTPVEPRPPHALDPWFDFTDEILHHLVWSNSIDARDPERPRWGGAAAVLAGSGVTSAADGADVILSDGTPVWIDAGPVRVLDPIDDVGVVHLVALERGARRPPVPSPPDAALASDQLAAVVHPGGSARIVAPAGSGKTRVLTERARHLVRSWGIPPASVVLVAFNKRAQVEMTERTSDLPGLEVRTLNSLALAIVNGAAPFASRRDRVTTVDEVEVRRILSGLVTFPRRRNTDPAAPWIEALSQIRLGLVPPDEVEARFEGDVAGLTSVWPRYRAELDRAGVVDFDGQIHRALEVLLTEPAARDAARRACRLLLVDEFQDLTPAHVLLIRLLAGPGGAVFGVGDDDQTIYGYQGADPAWLIEFAELFPGAGDHPLEVNYRCPPDIVDAADRLLRHNRRRVPKVIRAGRPAQDARGWSVANSSDPVGDADRYVGELLAAAVATSEIAILARVNAALAPIQVALTVRGVGVQGGVGLEFLERTAVRAVGAWLRLASGRFSDGDLREALRRPSRPLPPRVADWVCEQGDIDGLRRLAGRLREARDSDRVEQFATDLEQVRAAVDSGATASQVVGVLIDEIGIGGAVATLDSNRRGMNRSAQGDDLAAVRALAALHDDPRTLLDTLREHLAVTRDPAGVLLSTVHRVKGQEWPHVVVYLADADQYPHRLADDHEEERRLFHVAITRASTHARIVTGTSPTPFLSELTTEPPDRSDPDVPTTAPAGPTHRGPGRAARTNERASDPGADPLLHRGEAPVAVGTTLVDQGQEWVVSEVADGQVTARRGGTIRRFPLGARGETAGRRRGALVAVDEPAPVVVALDLLRRFRDGARQGKPAYTVFDDKTLVAIARATPADLEALSRIRGIGPAKLDQYGPEVLDVIEAARVAVAEATTDPD